MTGRVEGKVAIVIGGGQTPGQTVGNGRATAIVAEIAGAISGAQYKVIPGAPHMLFIEQPEAVARELFAFLGD